MERELTSKRKYHDSPSCGGKIGMFSASGNAIMSSRSSAYRPLDPAAITGTRKARTPLWLTHR